MSTANERSNFFLNIAASIDAFLDQIDTLPEEERREIIGEWLRLSEELTRKINERLD